VRDPVKDKTKIHMPIITFLPIGKTIDVPSSTLLMDAAGRAGIMIELPCGGKGTCGKCLVQITHGSVACKSDIQLTDEERASGFVVACQSFIIEDVIVNIPEQPACMVLDDSINPVCETVPALLHLSPCSQQVCLRVPKAEKEDGLSDLDRVGRSLKSVIQEKEIFYPLSVIQKSADALRAEDGMVTITLAAHSGKTHIIDIKGSRAERKNLGIAIDLGTTTISVQLIDLGSGKVISTRNGYNDQIHCGLDVISRINYASTRERLEDLRSRAVRSVNRLVQEVVDDSYTLKEDITCCRISGNTIMTHLFLGLKPEYLRLEPYTPTVLQIPHFRAIETGLDIHPEALVTFSPCVGSYVGGDITAGILATDLVKNKEETCLFIDIGTNGEIVLGNSDFLMTCACSAGPAFEGGGIDCGMRATTGAIDSVTIEGDTGSARYTTIGNGRPSGICGSGLIDLVAGLFLSGWIDSSGKLNRSRTSPLIHLNGRRASYTVAEAADTNSGKPIILSENDIENLMRAKAAIYSAAALMLRQIGISFHDISTFYIAGAFGRFLNLGNAMVIGLLPDIPVEKFLYIGNASLLGSCLCLLSKEYRDSQTALAKRMTYIDLSTTAGYMDQYTAALFLPHTDLHHFPNIAKRLRSRIS